MKRKKTNKRRTGKAKAPKRLSAKKQKLVNAIISAKAQQRQIRKQLGQLNNRHQNEEIKDDKFKTERDKLLNKATDQQSRLNEADEKLNKIRKNPHKTIDLREYKEDETGEVIEENLGKIWDIRDTIEDKIFERGNKKVNGISISKNADKVNDLLQNIKTKMGSKDLLIYQADEDGNITLVILNEDEAPEHLKE